MKIINNILTLIFQCLIAIIGYHLHHSLGWAIFDFFFAPYVLIKYLICKEINLSIIKEALGWFLN